MKIYAKIKDLKSIPIGTFTNFPIRGKTVRVKAEEVLGFKPYWPSGKETKYFKVIK